MTLRPVLVVIPLLGACEVDSGDCGDAKKHLCENIVAQACDTSRMENAVNKVRDACGSSESSSFQGEAEAYCQANAGSFDVDVCAALPEGGAAATQTGPGNSEG